MTANYKHWQLATDEQEILWLTLDRAQSRVNTINSEIIQELTSIIDWISQQKQLRGVVIQSAKKSGFIAGADITQFIGLTDTQQAVALVREAQLCFDRLEAIALPTVAMIDGFCLGGGLELALACRYRVACDNPQIQIGLPEVRLGIHPGWGGTVRLPQLINPLTALRLIVTGRVLTAKAAKKLGVVDEAVPKRQLHNAARYYVLHPKTRSSKWIHRLFDVQAVRSLVGSYLRRQLAQKVRIEHYPAPFAIIDNWVREGGYGPSAAISEANSIAQLFLTAQARNLLRVFGLKTRLKSMGKKIDVDARVQHVHVVGSGTMGGDIAAWCALQGLTVTLHDCDLAHVAPAIARAKALFSKKLKEPRLVAETMDRLLPDVAGHGVAKADIIIEAIFEDIAAKQALFKVLEQKSKPTALLATNTSSIPLEEIACSLQNPQRLIGLHFFNPVAQMELVEVVRGEQSSEESQQRGLAFVSQINRLALPVKSSPGFLVNRVLLPYLVEALILLREGFSPEVIDQCAVEFGMPMGPVELADTVGLDVLQQVGSLLTKLFGVTLPSELHDKVAQKQLGKKTGQGFYLYDKGRPVKSRVTHAQGQQTMITERLIFGMLNQAQRCLHERVATDADLIDAGMIFGTGFAPFLGGPLQYATQLGTSEVIKRLEALAKQYGERFKPSKHWDEVTS